MDAGTPEVPEATRDRRLEILAATRDMRPSVFMQQHGSALEIFTAMGMQRTRKSKESKGEELKRAQMYAKVKKLRESSDCAKKAPKETKRRQLQKQISKLKTQLSKLPHGQQNQEKNKKLANLRRELSSLDRSFKKEKMANNSGKRHVQNEEGVKNRKKKKIVMKTVLLDIGGTNKEMVRLYREGFYRGEQQIFVFPAELVSIEQIQCPSMVVIYISANSNVHTDITVRPACLSVAFIACSFRAELIACGHALTMRARIGRN